MFSKRPIKSPTFLRFVAVFSCAILLYYITYDNWQTLPFSLQAIHLSLAIGAIGLAWYPPKINQLPHLAFLMILGFWVFILYEGVLLSTDLDTSFYLIPWYVWGIGLGLGLLAQIPSPLSTPETISPHTRRAWVIFFMCASILRDSFFIWVFGINAQSDSNYYINSLKTLFYGGDGFDQPSYLPLQLFHAVLNSADNPWRVVIAQVVLTSLVLGLVVYHLSQRQITVAVVWGFFSLFDMVWAYNSRTLMTESLFINAFLLVILLVISHIERRETLSDWEVGLSGLFYGAVLLIRISGFPLVIPIVGVYILIRSSWRTPILVILGVALMFAGANAFARWQKTFAQNVNPHALTWGYTMFYYHTFSPDNGSASAELDQLLQACDLSYENYSRETSNAFAFLGLANCLDEDELGLLPAAYREMMLHNTVNYSQAVLNEAAVFATLDVQSTVLLLNAEIIDSTCYTTVWCLDLPRHYRYPLEKTPLFSLIKRSRYVQQPYFLLLPADYFGEAYRLEPHTFKAFTTREAPQRNFPALAGSLMLMGSVLILARGIDRIWVLAFSLFIWNQIGTSVTGQFFFPRLGMALSPFYTFGAAWVWVSLGKWFLPRLKLPRLAIQPILYGASVLCLVLSAYFAWGSQDQAAYGGDLLVSRVQSELLDWTGGTIFNPALINFDWRVPNPLYLGADTPEITAWRETKTPGYLKQASINYLMVDHIWFSYADEGIVQMLNDPAYYVLEREWSEGDQHIYLYQVVGDQTEAPH